MITNKDISIDSENGKITLNGNKYDLGTQGEIDTAVKDVYSVMGQMGAKNLIPYPYNHTTKTQNGVTFTDNGDGTITIVTSENGATANTTFEFQTRASEKLFLKAGKYKATGCPSIAGGGIIFRIANTNVSPGLIFDDNGSGVTFTLENDLLFGAIFTVRKDTVITTPIVVKPMLRLASDTDNTYEPYAMTNKQLTETIGDLTQTGLTGDSVAEQLGTAREQISRLDASKLTLVENKATSTGTTLTFDTQIQADTMYLIAMSAPVTGSAREMKCSVVRVVGTTTNEISFGNSNFVVTVNNLTVTITNDSILYGLKATLIKLE